MMHYLALAAAAVLPVMGQQSLPAAGDADHAAVTETAAERDARMAWWREAKFGMFIHYGLYSGLGGFFKGKFGGGEWIQRNLRLDTETYAAEAEPLFRPAEGCTEEWAKLAEEAGCRYMVLTSKHHEGFALFDAPNSDYSSMKLVGRDLVREFAESARRHGMRVGLYHSVIDWHQKDYDNTICPDLCYPEDQAQMLKARGIPRNHAAYQQYLHEQVRTLLTKYGKIDILWWDYSQGAAAGERGWKAPALMTMCRELQPGVIMNNRLYSFSGFDKSRDGVQLDLRCGDYTTPEKRIPEKGYPARGSFKMWLWNITRWRINDQFRRRKKDTAAAGDPDGEDPRHALENYPGNAGEEFEAVWEREWQKNVIKAAAERVKQKVTPKQFQIFECNVLRGMDAGEVRRKLGVSMAQVYLAKFRVGAVFRKEVEYIRSREGQM